MRRGGRALLVVLVGCGRAAATLAAADPAQPSAATITAAPTATAAAATGFRVDARPGGRRLAWLAPTGGPVRSTPAVAGDTVYFGSADGALHAVDSRSGRERWRFATAGPISSSPAVAQGTVFFTSRDRHLYAVDAESGRQRWRFAMGEDLPFIWGWDYFLSSPALDGGRVYVGSGDGHVYAVDARSGREAWRFKTGGRVRSSPAVADGSVYAGSMDGRLYALAADSGRLRWTFDTEGVTLDSASFRYDRTSVQSSPAIAGRLVVFGCRDGHLYAVDRESGRLAWRFDHETSWVVSSPAVFEGMALVGSSDGHFFQAVDLATGKERWRHATGSNVYASPAVGAGVVYFGCQDGTFYALDARSGEERWRFQAGSRIFSSPALVDGVLYFGCDDGALYALAARPPVAGPGRAAAAKAVFWNDKAAGRWFQGDVQVRDFFAAAGYQVLGAEGLVPFLRDRVRDRAPSVVVFASDVLPDAVAPHEEAAASAPAPLFRQYLEAGGKVVWLGAPPLLWDFDAAGKLVGSNKARVTRLLGVDHSAIHQDEYGSRLTADGARWGLRSSWISTMGVEPRDVTTVLALEEDGKAAAWVKSYGGPEGTGFVRLWGREDPCPDLLSVEDAAEHGLE
jgi:outer membrane protein assembly factor BamB